MKRFPIITFLYVLFFLFLAALLLYGRAYYFAPIAAKVRHPLHPLLRQSGTLGHLFGILGTLFMLLLLLYSIRKRFRFARNWGNLNTWLNVHIFLGITGPLLVLFHTVFKFSGIVALAFWSMVLVVISGIIGKYIYELIPHSLSGMELNRIELEAEEIGLTFEIRKMIPPQHPLWNILDNTENNHRKTSLMEPLLLFMESVKLKQQLRKILKHFPNIDKHSRKKLRSLVVKRRMLHRRIILLKQSLKIIHYWHLLHKPFVIIMFLVLMIHIYISARMGYLWIF
jgi:hypothetical protein